jgi:MFS family permease
VLLGPALNPINTTMIAIALVPIAQATGVSAALAIGLVARLYIVSAVARPALRRVAEIFGPKKVYVAGLLCAMVGALGALGVLVGWELRVESPYIDLRMLVRNGALTRTCLRMLITYTGIYLMVYGFTQWLQDAAGYSADHAGLIQLSTTALALVCSWIVARSSSVRKPLIAGSVPLLPGALLMVFVDAGSSLVYLLLLVGVFGITQGLGSVSNQEVVYHNAPKGQAGSASGLSRTAIQIGATIASSIIGPVFGESTTDAGVHTLAWIVPAPGLAGSLLTVADPALKGKEPE